MIFASAGFNVRIYDIAQAQIKARDPRAKTGWSRAVRRTLIKALEDIASQLRILEKDGLIRGSLSVGIQGLFLDQKFWSVLWVDPP